MSFSFGNKVWSLLTQSNSQNGAAPMTSMRQSTSTSTTKLFIGGLSFGTDDQSLKEAFSSFGDITEASSHPCSMGHIIDRESGRSKGFGFVNFADSESASSAMSAMNGQELSGRNIRVSFARERSAGPRNFGDGGYGGYGGN